MDFFMLIERIERADLKPLVTTAHFMSRRKSTLLGPLFRAENDLASVN